MQIEASTTIDRPISDVWRWYAVEHVRNHPRWDPDMHLEQISDGPIGLGTKIRRRNVRWGEPIEGEMEIVEWEEERAFAVSIQDANMLAHGRATFEADGPSRTSLRMVTDLPGFDESKVGLISERMQRSVTNVKRLIESEA